MYCARATCGRAPADPDVPGIPGVPDVVDVGRERGITVAGVLMIGYQMDASFSSPSSPRLAVGSGGASPPGSRTRRVKLRRDVGVAHQRQRHARIERRRHGLVVARKRVVNRMAERVFDLLGRNRVRLGGAVKQHAHALPARAELTDQIEQTLRVANRRHVGIRHEKHHVRRIQRRDRTRVDLAAGVHDDVFVLAREQPQQFFDRAAVRGAGPIELIRPGENLQPRLVLHDQFPQELPVEPVEVVDPVEQRIARADAEKQRDFSQPGLQIDDDGGFLAEARQLDAAVHGDGCRAGAALRAEEHQRRRRGAGALRRFAASRHPAYRALENVLGGRPDEELVRAGAHRLKDEIGIAGQRDDKNTGAWRRRAQPFDARHR